VQEACNAADTQLAVFPAQEGDEEASYATSVALDSLGGKLMRLNVRKRPGFEDEDVLGEPGEGRNSDGADYPT
jgi:hypothetical protein